MRLKSAIRNPRRDEVASCAIRSAIFVVFLAATVSVPAAPDPGEGSFKYSDPRLGEHKDVSDKFKFVRIQGSPMYAGDCLGDNCIRWSHDYPEAGRHFSKILTELSKLQVVVDEDEYIFSFADPNLFKYPFAYLAEVGDLELSEDEIKGLREYVLRGGFLLVDDFRGQRDMSIFEYNVKKALPEFQMKELDVTNPIFNCFFSIKSLDVRPVYRGYRPQFYGLEDKNGRLMMVINYNNDVSDYWQWSNDPFQPIEDTNTAYKFGVNYVFYALTH